MRIRLTGSEGYIGVVPGPNRIGRGHEIATELAGVRAWGARFFVAVHQLAEVPE